MAHGSVDIIVGLQRGDEGKGRITDLEAQNPEYEIIARANGGANAGHRILVEGHDQIALHQIPSGIMHEGKVNVIGAGAYVDPVGLQREIETLRSAGIRVGTDVLKISNTAHLVLPHHKLRDAHREGDGKTAQGSTKSGIAFVAADKFERIGLRAETGMTRKELVEYVREASHAHAGVPGVKLRDAREWAASLEAIKPFLIDTTEFVNDAIKKGRRILAEGAQAYQLDVNHGMYPAVTSSSTTAGGLLEGLGVAPKHVGKVTGVTKLVRSHVGGGPFVTEITGEEYARVLGGSPDDPDGEYGSTTGRRRRVGFYDLFELEAAVQVNGVDEIVINKMDHAYRFGSTMKVARVYIDRESGQQLNSAPASAERLKDCVPAYAIFKTWNRDALASVTSYQEVPQFTKDFIEVVEKQLETPVTILGIGPERDQIIRK